MNPPVVHSVGIANVRLRGSGEKRIRAECSCGWAGAKVQFRHTAERHKQRHLDDAGAQG